MKYLSTDSNAKTVWKSCNDIQKNHIIKLLTKYNDQNKDPHIFNLYGAIHTLLQHNEDITNYQSLDDLYKKTQEYNTISTKKSLHIAQTNAVIEYFDIKNDNTVYQQLHDDIFSALQTNKKSNYNTILKELLTKHHISYDNNLILDNSWINTLL